MSEEQDLLERRVTRAHLLKLAAATGGAGLMAGRAGSAAAALGRLSAESGRLQVLDWAGYGNDGGQTMFAQYTKQHAKNKPQFTYMTNESDALAKLHAGLKPDIFRPYVGWVKYFAQSGLVQPVGHVADPELQEPQPVHGQGRPVQRQAVRDPGGLGIRRDPLPNRQGQAEGALVGPPVRRTLQGQDRLVRRPRDAHGHRPLPRGQGSVEPDGCRAAGSRRSCSSPRSTSFA